MVDTHTKEQEKQVPDQVRDQVPVYVAKGLILERQKTKEEMELDALVRSYMSGHILYVHPAQSQTLSVPEQQYQLYLSMKDNPQLPSAVRLRDQEDPYDDAHPEGDNHAKRILTIDEEKFKEMADEMLRQRCTSGDEHQYHIDQMKNFLKSDIVWESRKKILVSPHLQKTTPLVQSCQRDPEASTLSLVNQDLLYLKKGSSGPEKIVLSLHKFPAIIFKDDDIEEQTYIW
ncbi:hypothetical protein Tco_0025379 [Tanacetum coccineum]